jgi:cytochrome c553
LYLTKQLGDFKRGTRAGNSNAKVMHGVAQTLSDDDIQALSAYLSTL